MRKNSDKNSKIDISNHNCHIILIKNSQIEYNVIVVLLHLKRIRINDYNIINTSQENKSNAWCPTPSLPDTSCRPGLWWRTDQYSNTVLTSVFFSATEADHMGRMGLPTASSITATLHSPGDSATDLTNQRHEWPTGSWCYGGTIAEVLCDRKKRMTANIVDLCCISSVPELPRIFIPFRDRRALSDPNAGRKVIACPGIHSKLPLPPRPPISCALCALADSSVHNCIYEDRKRMPATHRQDNTKQSSWCGVRHPQ